MVPTSPVIKAESSLESFLGSDLFDVQSSASPMMDPASLMTPEPFALESDSVSPSALSTPAPEGETAGSDKKPTKKRKSWGQVLPEPKTNLPPRKRAKTEDEKEQRRVERVLRNRRAAQSSRERKRQETEALAQKNKDLQETVLQLVRENAMLHEQLRKVRPDLGATASSNSVTFSQPLFPSRGSMSEASLDLMESIMNKPEQRTVDPASLSPTLTPVPEEPGLESVDEKEPTAASTQAAEASETDNSTTRSTQYPAAVLCSDLQCQRPVETCLCGLVSKQPLAPALPSPQLLWLARISLMTFLSLYTRPLGWIAMSMKTSSPLPQTPAILNTIIWLVTNHISTSPSSTSKAMAQSITRSSRSKTLRLRTLRKILTCNRQLARPLQDATLEVLRLSLSKGRGFHRVNGLEKSAGASIAASLDMTTGHWRETATFPSPERLMALSSSIRTLERNIDMKQKKKKAAAASSAASTTKEGSWNTTDSEVDNIPSIDFSGHFQSAGSKRKLESMEETDKGVLERRRLSR